MGKKADSVRERLKTLQMGQNLEDYAKRCGVQPATLRKYLTGERYPDSEQLEIMAGNLRVSIDWVISGKLLTAQEFTDGQIKQICQLDPEVIEVDCSSGKVVPVVRTYDNEKYHLQFFCIHCKCWHYHGRGGKDHPYTEGREGMAGDRATHCFAINSPFHKNGIILDVIGKLRELKTKPRSRVSRLCENCSNYYSAAFNACTCGWVGRKKDLDYPEIAELYKQISIYKPGFQKVNGSPLTWMVTGKEQKQDKKLLPEMEGFRESATRIGKIRKIPVISWVQAGDWGEVIDPFQPGYAEDWIDTTATNHLNAFALVVDGDSMEPEFRDGEIITVDPGREAINGSYVVAKNGNKATFKQLVIDGASVFLKPLNPRYPVKDMTGVEFRIVGVVVFKGKGY